MRPETLNLYLGIGILIGIGGGYAIGENFKGRGVLGAVLGGLLGVIGWAILAVMEDHRRKCWACTSAIPQAAIRCPRCGTDLNAQPVQPVLPAQVQGYPVATPVRQAQR